MSLNYSSWQRRYDTRRDEERISDDGLHLAATRGRRSIASHLMLGGEPLYQEMHMSTCIVPSFQVQVEIKSLESLPGFLIS